MNRIQINFYIYSDVYYANGIVKNFQEFLNNLFQPLFEATINPQSHPDLFRFMYHLTGFDSVDDETKPEKPILTHDMPHPEEWNTKENPPYAYYLVYRKPIINKLIYILLEIILVLYVCKHSYLKSTSKVRNHLIVIILVLYS